MPDDDQPQLTKLEDFDWNRLLRQAAENDARAFYATAVCIVCGSRLDEPDPNHPHYQHS